MAVKKAVRAEGGEEDFLGLAAIGSVIANIVQIARNDQLRGERDKLRKYALELERRYQETIRLNRRISSAYMSLKKIIREREDTAKKLEKENAGLKAELNGLRASNAKRPRIRRIERKG